jgi:hypothetical protein
MPSPLPGMDPYLECSTHWPVFQNQMTISLGEALQPSLGDRYRLRFAVRSYKLQQALFTSVIEEEHRESFVEVRCRATDRLVARIEVVSPANRTHAVSRDDYGQQRDAAHAAGAHVIELDLVLQGQTCLAADVSGLPDRQYVVAVTRWARPPRAPELYGSSLRKRLPRIRVPLASDDRDLILDVQSVFARVYDRHFDGKIDYRQPPPVRLEGDDPRWLDRLLRDQGLRA